MVVRMSNFLLFISEPQRIRLVIIASSGIAIAGFVYFIFNFLYGKLAGLLSNFTNKNQSFTDRMKALENASAIRNYNPKVSKGILQNNSYVWLVRRCESSI